MLQKRHPWIQRPHDRTTIAVYVATHRRNEPLARLLESVLVAANGAADVAAVAMIVVDDNLDGAAKEVVGRFDGRFELGLPLRRSPTRDVNHPPVRRRRSEPATGRR